MALKRGTAAANVLRGTSLVDTLLGLGGNDSLLGLSGRDTLDGGVGRDRMAGGRDNDTYIVDRSDDVITERAGEGTDTVKSSASFTLPAQVENLVLTGNKAVNGAGNAADNTITGNGARNTLLGRDGDDRLDGRGGADRMEGGEGDDVYVVNLATDRVIEAAGNGTDTVLTSVAIPMPGNVEIVVLTGKAGLAMTGTTKANAIAGNAGANELEGGGGNDVMTGGAGNDELIGGVGDDDLDGGKGNDSLLGGGGKDTLVGGVGNDVLDGGGGADFLVGGSGNDTYVVDNAGDRAVDADPGSIVIFPSAASTATVAKASLGGAPSAAALAPLAVIVGGTDEIRSSVISIDLPTMASAGGFEIVRLLGGLDLDITADAASSATITLIGNDGINTITGQAGDDVIDGGAGADSMVGGEGNDTYIVDDAGDTPVEDADEGTDTIVVTDDAQLNDFTNFENLSGSGDTGLILRGDEGNNTITGTAVNDALFGDDGADVLSGLAGNDQLEGQTGNDSITGGAGTDSASFTGVHADYTINVIAGVITVTDNNAGDGDDGTDTVATVERLDFNDTTVLAPIDLGGLDGSTGFRILGESANDLAGQSVASAGDINGDGFADVVIGALQNDNDAGDADAGAAYVVFGKADGFANVNLDDVALGVGGFKIMGEALQDRAGVAVASAGDVNGDGFFDVFVGAHEQSSGGAKAGAGYVIFGKATPFATVDLDAIAAGSVDGLKIVGEDADDRAGRSVAPAGDVNGDGIDDLLISAYRDDDGGADAGGAYVVYGTTGGFGTIDLGTIAAGTGGFKIVGESAFVRAGFDASSAGDFNGDGLDDILVSTPLDDTAGANAGAAYVVFGTAANPGTINLDDVALGVGGFKILGEDTIDGAGHSIDAAGDVNGDGFDDIVIGAYFESSGAPYAGAAYVLFGSDSISSTVNLVDLASGIGGFKITGENANDKAGFSVAGIGDMNMDGLNDILIGASGEDAGGTAAGAAYVVFGGGLTSVDLDAIAAGQGGFKLFGEDATDEATNSVGAAGDVNGDGFDDIIIGAYANQIDNSGAGYVFFGRDFTFHVTQLGDADADVLTGDADANIIVGAQGDDTIDGGLGDDKLIGAAGDDVLIFDAADSHRIDGGAGSDILVFVGAGESLDLTTVNAAQHYTLYFGLEAIDLAGTGGNTLNLDIQDLLHLSDTTNALRVDGGGDDTVTTQDTGWGAGVADADIAGYTTYTNGNAKLIVDTDIVQSGVQA